MLSGSSVKTLQIRQSTRVGVSCLQVVNVGQGEHSKTCVKRPLKIDKTKVLMATGC